MLSKSNTKDIPFHWENKDNLSESDANRVEVYLLEPSIDNLIIMFYRLFGSEKGQLLIHSESWGDFTLDTWNPHDDTYDYSNNDKSMETVAYLNMLKMSGIEYNYSGVCSCSDWNSYLDITLKCILTHIAPFGHKIYNKDAKYFFYFHHTYSIGLYYKNQNTIVSHILDKLNSEEYEVRMYT
ncbi:MAG: hypothetical protein H6551_02585 [Chitinophagales bacterium]|nr:hypothetical protein [Chitinophagales bacterium]